MLVMLMPAMVAETQITVIRAPVAPVLAQSALAAMAQVPSVRVATELAVALVAVTGPVALVRAAMARAEWQPGEPRVRLLARKALAIKPRLARTSPNRPAM
jgi:uncharacterized membrane protein YoaK (UPF0700 family)